MYPVKFKTQTLTPFNRLMEDFFDHEVSYNSKVPVNIKQTDKGFGIELSVPGYNKEEIQIEVENKILKIKGEHKVDSNENSENYTRREFTKSSFERSFSLPTDIKEDEILASYNNGILTLELFKKEQVKTTHTVAIK